MKIKSKKQAGLFGAAAGGASYAPAGLSAKTAKKDLKGLHVSKLPDKVKKKKKRK